MPTKNATENKTGHLGRTSREPRRGQTEVGVLNQILEVAGYSAVKRLSQDHEAWRAATPHSKECESQNKEHCIQLTEQFIRIAISFLSLETSQIFILLVIRSNTSVFTCQVFCSIDYNIKVPFGIFLLTF